MIKNGAARKLANDPSGILMLIALSAEYKLDDEVKQAIHDPISKNRDKVLQALGKKYFSKNDENNTYLDRIAVNKGNALNGKSLFLGYCGYCHKVNDTGAEIGPELTMVKNKYDEKSLLEAIAFPNKGVEFGYEPVIITTKDGAAAIGFVYTNGNIIVLKNPYGEMQTIESDNVDMMVHLKASIMPDPQIMGLSEEGLADIVNYLMTL